MLQGHGLGQWVEDQSREAGITPDGQPTSWDAAGDFWKFRWSSDVCHLTAGPWSKSRSESETRVLGHRGWFQSRMSR